MAKKKTAGAGNHGTKDIQAQLEALEEEEWDVEENEGGFGEVPSGEYQVQINKATINNAKSSGRLQISYELTIVSGKMKNRKLFKHEGLDTTENKGKNRAILAKLGVGWPKSPGELPEKLEEIVGTYALVSVNTKESKKEPGKMDSWTNFKKAIDEDELDDVVEQDEDEEAEEKPKKKKSKDDDEEDAPKPKKKKPKPEPEEDEDEDEEDEEDSPKPKKKPGKTVDEPTVDLAFEEEDLTPKHKKLINKLATALEFDPDNYDDMSALLVDLAEHVGIAGKFSSPDKLIAKINEKAEDTDEDDDEEEKPKSKKKPADDEDEEDDEEDEDDEDEE